ncbi:FecR family protein [Pedobacter xixiisoli]|uniref:FecR family protein n=1 Tax=Pedobacter xixiisoli TaxID=1476464 RepID=A0A286A758_9SPHI|nr:FecR family protein [Pedobacter xixiisoli]SOD17715.1 FecR family protein [Pedobacter xixiisoli]
MKRIETLYSKYLDGTITDAEKKELFDRIRNADDQSLEQLSEKYLSQEPPEDLSFLQEKTDRVFSKIKGQLNLEPEPKKHLIWHWLPYVAAIIITTAVFIFIVNQRITSRVRSGDFVQISEDIPAGTNRATLTLGNGRSISLDQANAGQIAAEQGVRILKTDEGQLAYEVLANTPNSAAYNTISTPNGGQFTVTLPDGTTVYLNAASTLKYPTSFVGAERHVELSGEAYFEVAKNKGRTFTVSTDKQKIQVLGTHFNVNSYQDNGQIITTLAEGSVKVITSTGSKLLIPGQQTIVNANSIKLQEADLETAMAWKNGRIEYKDADIQTIMADVARWYNIEVHYEGSLPERRFMASIRRDANLASLLKVLRLSDINFEMRQTAQGKLLIVKP